MKNSEKFWDRLSKNYDKRAKDTAYRSIIGRSKKHLKADDLLLDFGCATGLYSIPFARCVREIQAFDISPNMLDIAREKARANDIDNISFQQTTIFDETFCKSSFDTILALNILLYFKEPESVLKRMRDLLKPNGLIITSTACLKEKRSFVGILASNIISILKRLKILPYLRHYSMHELEEKIKNCGFKIVETHIVMDKPATEYYIVAQKDTSKP